MALATMIVGALFAGTAWAPKNLFIHGFQGDCTFPSGHVGEFTGDYTVYEFGAKDGEVVVSGVLEGTCEGTLPEDKPETASFKGEIVTTFLTDFDASCEGLAFSPVGEGETSTEIAVDVSAVDVLINGLDGVTRGQLCALTKAEGKLPAQRYAPLLNKLLGLPPATF